MRRNKLKAWDRFLWGVKFHETKLSGPMLIGDAWDNSPRSGHFGMPSRPLLFKTRDHARAWCDVQNAKNMARTDCCAGWRFSAVRVREVVRVAAKKTQENKP